MTDSSRQSSVVAGLHGQADSHDLQDPELVTLQPRADAPWLAHDLVRSVHDLVSRADRQARERSATTTTPRSRTANTTVPSSPEAPRRSSRPVGAWSLGGPTPSGQCTKRDSSDIETRRTNHLATMERLSSPKPCRDQDALCETAGAAPARPGLRSSGRRVPGACCRFERRHSARHPLNRWSRDKSVRGKGNSGPWAICATETTGFTR